MNHIMAIKTTTRVFSDNERFGIHRSTGIDINQEQKKKNPNIRGEKIGTLWMDGMAIMTDKFPLLNREKSRLCRIYGIGPLRAKNRFKITY